MNKYLKQYIELQKQFRETEGNPDSVRALYAFKEELEQSEDRQAKEVLVDVYDLLDFKKDAYELLCQIGDRSNKKTLKRLGTLKDYAENWGNQYAIPKPKTPDEKQKERERQAQLGLPTFRYHPNPLETGAFEESKEGVVCDCCGKMTHIFYTNPFFSVEDIAYLCPESVSYTHLDVYKRQFLPCSPHCKPEVQEDNELNGDYDFYRPIIRLENYD